MHNAAVLALHVNVLEPSLSSARLSKTCIARSTKT